MSRRPPTRKSEVHFWTDLQNRLKDPFQLRVICCAVALVAGYAGIYSPLSSEIDSTRKQVRAEMRRLEVATQVMSMRRQLALVDGRIPEDTDTNEWISYIVAGVRDTTLKLQRLDPEEQVGVGPFQAVKLNIAVEGDYAELDTFLHWLETNSRLFRVDSVKITAPRASRGSLVMNLTVLGLMG